MWYKCESLCDRQKYMFIWTWEDDFVSVVHRGTEACGPPAVGGVGLTWRCHLEKATMADSGMRTEQESSSKLWVGRVGQTLPSLPAAIWCRWRRGELLSVVHCWSYTPEAFPEAPPLPPSAAWLLGAVASPLAQPGAMPVSLGRGSDRLHLGTPQTEPKSSGFSLMNGSLVKGTCFSLMNGDLAKGATCNWTGLVGFF